MELSEKVKQRLDEWAKAWENSYCANQKRMSLSLNSDLGDNPWNARLEFEPGKKYIRVVQTSDRQFDRSAHAFLNPVTGEVFKAASWKAPAKDARYNLLDDLSWEKMLGRLDWAGGYLYK